MAADDADQREQLTFGAGEGNRTLVSSLGSYSSTIELRPREGTWIACEAADGKVQPINPPATWGRVEKF